jgi:putative selenate reductase molybdopterin-binding subunit
MEKIARALNLDPLEFRLKNALRAGELHPFSTAWSEGREPRPRRSRPAPWKSACARAKRSSAGIRSWQCRMAAACLGQAALRRGIGVALVMQGTAIPYLDMGGASLKMNDDGSFNLLIGATDLGTGSDTVLAQMAAETLGVPLEDMVVYSSDTDFTPFDKGAYASSTTYISGTAVVRAAQQVAERIRLRAADMFNAAGRLSARLPHPPDDIRLANARQPPMAAASASRRLPTMRLHHENQEQIMGGGSYVSPVSPPPFAAQFAEVTVDIQTGQVVVDRW